jgi:ElaB/YqjD/DUF883 family membrane-anchored ribosome-binding protein
MSKEYPTTYEAVDELRGIVDKAEELLKTLTDDGSDIAAELRTRVGNTVRTARERIGEIEESAKDVGTHALQATDEYVTSNPWMAVAVAAALGALVGAAIVRR